MPGRTAGADRPSLPSLSPAALNGLKELPEALFRNAPLSLVVLQLGTNDMLLDPALSPQALAQRIVVTASRRRRHRRSREPRS
jgi:lysophospholipase L1-like esterase